MSGLLIVFGLTSPMVDHLGFGQINVLLLAMCLADQGDAAAARADAGTGVGNPVERIVAPASDGPLTLKLWSATRGVVETRTGVAGGETVEFAIPEWNCWHWVGGWCESDNALVLSLWLRHGFVE